VAELRLLQSLMLILLGFTGGYVDAMSYFGFERVFTAAMTGNTVLLALAIAQGDPPAALRSGLALLGFVGGVALTHELARRTLTRAGMGPAFCLGVELSLLLGLVMAWIGPGAAIEQRGPLLLIVLAAAAMGMQSIAVREMGQAGIATTYITGTITKLTADVLDWGRGHITRIRQRSQIEPLRRPISGPWLAFSVWLIYALGAVAGGFGTVRGGGMAAIGPCLTIGLPTWCAYRIGKLSR
jgi:uncharacterized membrane protein YoaK (UPF0700 family)